MGALNAVLTPLTDVFDGTDLRASGTCMWGLQGVLNGGRTLAPEVVGTRGCGEGRSALV
jgi:hypothetical protein